MLQANSHPYSNSHSYLLIVHVTCFFPCVCTWHKEIWFTCLLDFTVHTYIKCKPHWSYLITTKRALTCKQPLSCLCFLKIDWWSWNTASIPLGFSSSSSSALFHLLHWPLDTSQQLPKLVTFTAFIIFLFKNCFMVTDLIELNDQLFMPMPRA